MFWFFGSFFVSGFCSILYELIWMRLAMAQFGVTTALVSIVLSVFMAGLGGGSWIAGALVRRYNRLTFPPLRLYGIAEALIGISALTVPLQFRIGGHLLARLASHETLSSSTYYLASGAILAVALIPWCACMGATIPLAMFAIRSDRRYAERRSFSFLYVANLLGSTVGCCLPLLLIELYGFDRALLLGALLNAAVAALAFALTVKSPRDVAAAPTEETPPAFSPTRNRSILLLLFTTGCATMGMEVGWIRLFTAYIGPVVYSFALILATYLAATFTGSQLYRRWSRTRDQESRLAWISLALLGLLPLVTSDARMPMNGVLRVILGIAPFAGVIGFLTPMLVDRWSAGDPDRAGRGYAVNVAGCIVGPLISGFVLLPLLGEHWSMLLFVLPWLAMAIPIGGSAALPRAHRSLAYGSVLAAFAILIFTKDYETQFRHRRVLRDNTATVIATGEALNKRLLVNGIGMTVLTPVTKMMAHLSLASVDHAPEDGLVICFGMGTTFRSMLSWGVRTTAVELIPSVPKLIGFYHRDGPELLQSPLAHVVIDDGRRYLDRSTLTYDVILLDPPPPVTAAGSSLLYSQDFYRVAKLHLRAGGILQQWLPYGDDETIASVARALQDSFRYVRVYRSLEGWGWHFLVSMTPIPDRTSQQLLARMPAKAVADMMEWGPARTPEEQFGLVLAHETTLDQMIALSSDTPPLQDDRPVNEYFLLRRLIGGKQQSSTALALR